MAPITVVVGGSRFGAIAVFHSGGSLSAPSFLRGLGGLQVTQLEITNAQSYL